MGKVLIGVGLLLVGISALSSLGFPLGRLPGDIVWRRGTATIYMPIATSVLMSVVLTLALMLWRR